MSARRRVAVVDDDEAMVSSLCQVLELHGWETVPAHDGAAAVELVDRHDIPLVVMDIRMPRMNGVEALEEIKRRAPRTAVVLVSAGAPPELVARAERAGAGGILRKPVDPRSLVSLLGKLEALRRGASAP